MHAVERRFTSELFRFDRACEAIRKLTKLRLPTAASAQITANAAS
jgi:hypothetical protein